MELPKIETGVTPKKSSISGHLRQMKPGDSFVVPLSERNKWNNNMRSAFGNGTYRSEKQDDGVSIRIFLK